jgi:hypothetical protein
MRAIRRHAKAVAIALFILAWLAGCGNRDRGPAAADAKTPAKQPAAANPPAPEAAPAPAAGEVPAGSRAAMPLTNASASADELMTRVLEAVASADAAALDALRLTEEEHREILWPNDPGRAAGAPLDLAWDMLDRRSRSGAHKAIAEYGGRSLALAGIEFTQGSEPRGRDVLHRGTVLHARDSSRGESVELRFLGSVLEHAGQWKLVSFRD